MTTRILVYRVGAFGDTLLLAFLFKKLRISYAKVHITLAANPNYASPLLDSGLIHEILDGGALPFRLLYSEQTQENDALYRLIEQYDKCMFYTSDISGELANRLNSYGLNKCLLQSPFPPASEEIHISDWMTRSWSFLGAIWREKLILKPSQKNLVFAANTLNEFGIDDEFFVVHPGGGGKNKWVPPEILAPVVRRYAYESGQHPVIIEGPADFVACENFQRFYGDVIPVFKDITPTVLSGIFSMSSAYLGGDSGVSHLASLYAPRATILYGPDSNMRAWHPIGNGTLCIPWETIRG